MPRSVWDGDHTRSEVFTLQFLSAGSTVVVTGRREENLKEATQRHPGLHYIISDASGVFSGCLLPACWQGFVLLT